MAHEPDRGRTRHLQAQDLVNDLHSTSLRTQHGMTINRIVTVLTTGSLLDPHFSEKAHSMLRAGLVSTVQHKQRH